MKKQLLATSVAAALLASAGFSMSVQAEEESKEIGITAMVGVVSDYYYRGVNLGDAGAQAGLEYGIAGFYIGTWAIDDGGAAGEDGFETDFYLGYGMEHGIFSWDINYTRYEYTYTGDYEHEIGVNLGLAGVSLGLVAGEDKDEGLDAVDYNVFTLGYGYDIYSVTVGHYVADGGAAADPKYSWAEFAVAGEVSGFDVGLTIGTTFGVKEDALGMGATKSGDGYIFLDVSKSFSF